MDSINLNNSHSETFLLENDWMTVEPSILEDQKMPAMIDK